MRTPLDDEADKIVAEMTAIGATFHITRGGADIRWFYEAKPGMREPLRRYRQSLDLTMPGMQTAMLRAVARLKFVGAP